MFEVSTLKYSERMQLVCFHSLDLETAYYIPGTQSKTGSTDIIQTAISQYLYTINQSSLLRENCPIIQNVFYKIINFHFSISILALHECTVYSSYLSSGFSWRKNIEKCQNTFKKNQLCMMDKGVQPGVREKKKFKWQI